MNTWNAQTKAKHTEYIDKKELARRLNKDPRTISAWMRRGILPYYKVGRTVMFNWPEVKGRLGTLVRNGEEAPMHNAEYKMMLVE